MAHIYVGNRVRIDDEVLAAVRQLPDNFWAFAEFNINRNVDWLVVRQSRGQPTLFILTETKGVNRPLRGTDNGPWEQQLESGDWQVIQPSNRDDANYYWQAVNTANELKYWLWLNQPRFRDAGAANRPQEDFNVWPDVLLVSPPDVRHQLPLRPSSGFGLWLFSIEAWKQQLLTWRPKPGIVLSEQELESLGRTLDLELLPGEPQPLTADDVPAAPPLNPLADWMVRVDERLVRIEAALRSLEVQLSTSLEGAASSRRDFGDTASQRDARNLSRPFFRQLSPEEGSALVAAVESLAQAGRNRTFPSVLAEMTRYLHFQLKDSNYNQFGTAKAFFEQAASDGIIRLEGLDTLHPTVWLPGEVS